MISYVYETINSITGNVLNITKGRENGYDELAQKIFRSDCPYFAAPVTEVTINGETIFRYDIGSSKAVGDMNMKMSGKEFMRLLKNLITPLTECCDWMLDSHQFIMSPELVFVSGYDYKVKYIYNFDTFARCSDEDITCFFSEIIKKVRITDSAELSNSLLRMVVDNNVTVASLLDMINRFSESNYKNSVENIASVKRNIRPDSPVYETVKEVSERETVQKESSKPEIKFPGIVPNLAKKAEVKEDRSEKPDIPDEMLSSERDKAMEMLFGGGKSVKDKKVDKKNDKKAPVKNKDSLFKFLKKDRVADGKTEMPLQAPANFSDNEETVFAGVEGETELAGQHPYFILKEKKGDLNAPLRIDIFLDGNDEMYIGRQCDNPEHGGYKFDPEFKKISRTHAKITCDGMDYYITDLGSANKTILNGANIVPNAAYPLSEGAVLSFGDSLYLYEFRQE